MTQQEKQAIIQKETAKRAWLEGKDFTREDFEANQKNYLIEAGAGAGKTTIMSRRIVNQLISGYCEPEDVVAITFTKKSTLELRERLDRELHGQKEKTEKALTGAQQAGDTALEDQLSRKLRRIDDMMQESGRMQVSTIHSFCQTMLESMPFSSPLGLDMRVIEDAEGDATEFFRKKMLDPQVFRAVKEWGMTPKLLQQAFVERSQNSEATILFCDDPAQIALWEKDTEDAACKLQEAMNAKGVPGDVDKALRDLIRMDPNHFKNDPAAIRAFTWKLLYNGNEVPFIWGISDKDKKAAKKGSSRKDLQELWVGPLGKALHEVATKVVHSHLMQEMCTLLAEYRADKEARHVATYNDLLLRTRDMLRDDPAARAYFHKRYRVLYVDEMQDTDPVQAEFLFYLTNDETQFTGTSKFDPVWTKCKPTPGSLFLVGDPKQAIYRFRGADIGVYNTLLQLFQSEADAAANGVDPNAIGEKVTLQFNYRSSEEICALTDQVFAPGTGTAGQKYQLSGGTYQAEYVPMIAINGTCPRARTVQYIPGNKETDAQKVAAFIKTMIDHKIEVGIDNPGFNRFVHAAEPKDFLILPSAKTNIALFAEKLTEQGIAVDVTGEESFKDTEPVAKAVRHLRSMLAPRDDRLLLDVLEECYGCSMERVRLFLQRTGKYSLSGLVNLKELHMIRRALEAEPSPDYELLSLCVVLEEIAALRKLAKTAPAMAVVEQLLSGGYGVWGNTSGENLQKRQQTYAEVQMYLNLVRKCRERSFPAVAAYAIECAEKSFEQMLNLIPSENAVRIMNLHKAKGLEAEIVILPVSWQADRVPLLHVTRTPGAPAEEQVALARKLDYIGEKVQEYALPDQWATYRAEEKKYLEAEYARLLYVAATRAATMLVVFDRDPAARDPWTKNHPSYWDPMMKSLKGANPTQDQHFAPAFQALQSGVPVPPPQSSTGQNAPPAQNQQTGTGSQTPLIVPVQPDAMEANIAQTADGLTKAATYPITPSQLDKHVKRPADEDEADASNEADEAKAAADADLDDENEDEAVFVDAETVPAEEADAEDGPHGPVWGTIVHRVMELAVQSGTYEEAAVTTYATQAVFEELSRAPLDKTQRKALELEETDDDRTIIGKLVPKVVRSVKFLTQETSELRQLLAEAVAYPEMQFFLQAGKDDETTGKLYRHLQAHIKKQDAEDRVLAVEGVIDLAVLKNDGWFIVDYKTDRMKASEDEDAYKQRLKDEYTPQIASYARVLEQMTGKKYPVKDAWLCAIPLKGRFIKLEI